MSHAFKSAPAIPLTILTGFLGSGKTSLLNHLLHHPEGRKITALINDFGSLNIDAEIIARQHGGQIELANGCVCCSLGDDLGKSLADILNHPDRPDNIVIEASGIADPARIAAFASIDPLLRLDGVVCCVDATQYERQSQDPRLSDTFERQTQSAHLFAITKLDALSTDAAPTIPQTLHALLGAAPKITVTHGHADPGVILGAHHIDANPERPLEQAKHPFIHYFGHVPAQPAEALESAVRELGPTLLRAKGFGHDEAGSYMFHYVCGTWRVERLAQAEQSPSQHAVLIGFPELSLDGSPLQSAFTRAS